MIKDRKLWIAVAVAVATLVAAAPTAFGAEAFGPTATVASVSGNVVYVAVSNPGDTGVVAAASVRASVGGVPLTVSVPVAVPAGTTLVVPVSFPQPPGRIIGCGAVIEDVTPY